MNLERTVSPDLFRDADNGAILCTDITGYMNYVMNRNNALTTAKLEQQIMELKEMLARHG